MYYHEYDTVFIIDCIIYYRNIVNIMQIEEVISELHHQSDTPNLFTSLS